MIQISQLGRVVYLDRSGHFVFGRYLAGLGSPPWQRVRTCDQRTPETDVGTSMIFYTGKKSCAHTNEKMRKPCLKTMSENHDLTLTHINRNQYFAK